jgi:hypothetical protein
MTDLAIEATGLTKSFGKTRALTGVDLAARTGTVLAVGTGLGLASGNARLVLLEGSVPAPCPGRSDRGRRSDRHRGVDLCRHRPGHFQGDALCRGRSSHRLKHRLRSASEAHRRGPRRRGPSPGRDPATHAALVDSGLCGLVGMLPSRSRPPSSGDSSGGVSGRSSSCPGHRRLTEGQSGQGGCIPCRKFFMVLRSRTPGPFVPLAA